MPVRGMYIDDARFVGKSCRLKVSNFVPNELSIIIDNGPATTAYGLQIKNIKETLLPILKEMYPEEFGPDVNKYMDRVDDAVRANEKEQRSHIRSEEWFEGYEAAVEIMQDMMNEITQELKHADKG